MPNVAMPNGDIVAFPDDMPREQIKGMIASKFPEVAQPQAPEKPSVTEDVAKSVGSNLLGGGIDMAMTVPNMVNMAATGPQMLYRGIRDTFKGAPTDNSPMWQPFYGSSDVEEAIGTAYEPKTTAGKVAALPARIAGGITAAKGTQKIRPSVNKLLESNTSGRPQKPPQASADDIKALSQQAYAAADKQGGTLTPKFTEKFLGEAGKVTPQTEAGKLLAGDSPVTKIVDRLQNLKGRQLSLKEAQEIDEFLGDAIDDFTTLGVVNKQGKKLLDIQTSFRKMIDDASPADIAGGRAGFDSLKEGRRLWASSARMRDVEKIITRAEMTDNPATALKTGFRNLYNNPARIKGFNPAERQLIKKAAESGVVTELLRTAGSRLTPIIATATGAGGLTGATAAQAASMAARGGAAKLQSNRAANLSNTIANNALRPPQPQAALPALLQTPALSRPLEALAITAPQRTMIEGPMRALPAPRQLPAPQQSAPRVEAEPQLEQPATGRSDLFSRVIQRESGGRQFDKSGKPLTSEKGAVGVAQVMPKTAPEAAKAAGVKWDSKRYHNDPEYNALLGKAYLDKMLTKYKNNEALALMSYNWGPGNVDKWLKAGAKPERVPTETRKYVSSILSGSL